MRQYSEHYDFYDDEVEFIETSQDEQDEEERRKKEKKEAEDSIVVGDYNPYFNKKSEAVIKAMTEKVKSVPFTDHVESLMKLEDVEPSEFLQYMLHLNFLYFISKNPLKSSIDAEKVIRSISLCSLLSNDEKEDRWEIGEVLTGADSMSIHILVNVVIISSLNTALALGHVSSDFKPKITIGGTTYHWAAKEESLLSSAKFFEMTGLVEDDDSFYNSIFSTYTVVKMINNILGADVASPSITYTAKGKSICVQKFSDLVAPKLPNQIVKVTKVVNRMLLHPEKYEFDEVQLTCLLGSLNYHGIFNYSNDFSIYGTNSSKKKSNYMTFKKLPWKE